MLLVRAAASLVYSVFAVVVIWGVVLLGTTLALFLSAGLVAAALRLRTISAYLLAIYLIAYAELVLLVAALSLAHLVVRWAVISGVGVLLAASVVTWTLAGRPRGPAVGAGLRRLAIAVRDPPLVVLAAVVVLGFAYITALAFFTPPNSFDALWYHLSRVAFWNQQHAVGYIADVNDARLNGNPPIAEIGMLYTIVVGESDRFVTAVALGAYIALPIAVYGLARRLLVEPGLALCAGLVFAALPVPLLLAPGAKNDLVLASFATACVYFALGTGTVELVLAAVALALALGTKIYAPFFVPIIALITAVGTSKRRALTLAAAAVPAIVVGSAWNLINVLHSKSFTGNTDAGPISGTFDVFDFVPVSIRYLIDFGEVPGAAGWWFAGYVVAAVAIAVLLFVNRDRWNRAAILASALIALIPFLVIAFGPLAKRGYQYILYHAGRPDLGILDSTRDMYFADPVSAYYGPLGLALLFGVFVLIRKRRDVPRVAIALAAAPLLLVLITSLTLGYSEWSGRFFLFAMALAVASFALFLSSRPVMWAVVALSVPTVPLTLHANSEKPLSLWGKPRWQVQTHTGPGNEESQIIRFAEESIPLNARIGLAINPHDWSYPFFGPRLERHVRFVPSTQQPPGDVDWLVLSPERRESEGSPPGVWRVVLRTPHGWRLYRR
jgi:hypothetical protein